MVRKPMFLGTEIVVVDDTELFALCVRSFFAMKGFSAIELYLSPVTALEEIRRRGRPGYIITDLEMPFMTGEELLGEALEMYPEVKGVIITASSAVPPRITGRFRVFRKDATDFFEQLLRHVQAGLGQI